MTPPTRQSFQVMAKPIGPRCNMDCRYCYYLEKERLYPDTKKFAMDATVLETYIAQYIESQTACGIKEIAFFWQGGEPTLLGVDYFETVVALQRRYLPDGARIQNALQTNGTLLDERWARFLKRADFLVGLSLDGPAAIHDRFRKDRRRRGTHAQVMNALTLLKTHAIAFNTLTVVHADNVMHGKEIYHFLKDAGARFLQFIPVVERCTDTGELAPAPQNDDAAASYPVTSWSVPPDRYGDFLCTVFDEWLCSDVGRVFVQYFDTMLGIFLGAPSSLCWFAETCGRQLAIEHNGDVFSCDHYVYPAYKLGNITQISINDLVADPKQKTFGQDKRDRLPAECRQCSWRFACNGGCPKHRFLRTRTNEPGLNYFCQSQIRFLQHAAPTLQKMAALLTRAAPAPSSLHAPPSRKSGV